jgi:RNA polymerase sigma-70 factor (ECF subfamily)
MFRDATYADLTRTGDAADDRVDLVMDEETFRGFYERTARALWAYLVRVTGDRTLADDLLQETFYRFLRASATHQSEAHRRNSLYCIATNLARDARRRRAVRGPQATTPEAIESIPAPGGAAGAERQADLARAMSALQPRERAMLWLAYAEGASHREIAGVLELSPASLRPLLFRVRKKLAALLTGQTSARPAGETQ